MGTTHDGKAEKISGLSQETAVMIRFLWGSSCSRNPCLLPLPSNDLIVRPHDEALPRYRTHEGVARGPRECPSPPSWLWPPVQPRRVGPLQVGGVEPARCHGILGGGPGSERSTGRVWGGRREDVADSGSLELRARHRPGGKVSPGSTHPPSAVVAAWGGK